VKRFLKTKDNFVEWFDVDKIAGPLIVRQRQEGDRFQPIGAKGEKKVARFLQDGQFDAKTRETAFVIEDIEKILWVVPVRMSERAKITPKSRHLLEVCISERT
jgi:tRNA(Ile)-lysidine synthase